MTLYSQRDARWNNLILGFGDTQTIGMYGCTITCIANILGVTPDVVNERLKAVNGFLGALVIWGKLAEAFPGIKFTRVWIYDNADVKAHVPNVLVEVPATAIGGSGKHWVRFVGNAKCDDPWTGKTRPTSDFTSAGDPTGYCIVEGQWNQPSPTNNEQSNSQAIIDELRTARDGNWQLYQEEVKKNNDLQNQLNDEISKNQNLREINTKLTTTDENLGAELLDAQHKLTEKQQPIEQAKQEVVATQVIPLQNHALSLQSALDGLIMKRAPKKSQSALKRLVESLFRWLA